MADDRRNFLKQVAAGILGSGVRIGAGMSAVRKRSESNATRLRRGVWNMMTPPS